MEVILKKDVPNVGRMGEVVNVKPGFARNFLIPRSLASLASRGNKKMLEHQHRLVEAQKKKVKAESEEKSKEVSKLKLSMKKRFNEQDKMFGSITQAELVEALKAEGYEFDKRDIEIGDIREAGTHKIKVRLPGDVFSEVQLKIDPIKEEASKEKKAKATKKPAKTKAKSDNAKESEENTDKSAE